MKIEIKEATNSIAKKVVGTQIPIDVYEKLREESENDFMSISDLLRKIIYLHYRDKKIKESEKIEKENI